MRWLLVALGALMLVGAAGAAAPAPTVSVSSTANSITLGSLQCGKRYHVRVQVYDSRGALSNTTTLDPSTSACPPPAPPPPPPPVAPPPPPPPPPATSYVSPLGSDANPCSQALPCQSFARAYQASACGVTIEVAAGNYPDQDIPNDASKTSCASNVVIHPAAGANVVVGTKTNNLPSTLAGNDHGIALSGADHLTVSGFTIHGEAEVSDSIGSIYENVTAVGGNLYVASPTQDVIVRGSSFGGTNHYQSKVWFDPNRGGQNVNLTLDGDTFHDVLTDDLSQHVEGLLVIQEQGFTLRNSTFTNNAIFDFSSGECCGGSRLLGPITLEGNHFDSARSGVSDYTVASLNFNTNTATFPPFTVRFNSFALGESGSPAPGTYCGNTGNAPASWQTPC